MTNTRSVFFLLAVLSLVACLVPPVLYFAGTISAAVYESLFLVASVVYFVFAILWHRSAPSQRQTGP